MYKDCDHELEIFDSDNCPLCRIKELERRFPMIDGPDIDWITAEKIYEMYSYMYGKSQSLERLAERGGAYWSEVAYITKIYKKKKALEDK